MTYNSVQLNVFPTFAVVNRFLSDIVPRLTASDLYVNYDPASLQETEDGYATATIEVYDLAEQVFVANECTISYAAMADLATVLERKQVELQLNALLPRMAAVGWQFELSGPVNPFLGDAEGSLQKLTLTHMSGTKQDFVLSYAALNQLRQELTQAEATQYVQSHWLELEAANCEVSLNDDAMSARQNGNTKLYGYTLEEAKDLVKTALTAKKPLESTQIV